MPVELSLDALALDRWIRPGDGVVWGQACAEPVVLVDALLGAGIAPLSVFVGLSWRELRPPEGMRVVSYGALGRLGRLPELEVVPCHYSALPGLFAARRLPGDVVLVQVSPPDGRGRCSMGVGVDYLADALAHARDRDRRGQRPLSRDGRRVDRVGSDRCRSCTPRGRCWRRRRSSRARPSGGSPAHVAEIVDDGDTIQLGVGALPEAILVGADRPPRPRRALGDGLGRDPRPDRGRRR